MDLRGIARALLEQPPRKADSGRLNTHPAVCGARYYIGTTTSLLGKLKEAILALKIDSEQSKETVLENYLNTIYFGRGAAWH